MRPSVIYYFFNPTHPLQLPLSSSSACTQLPLYPRFCFCPTRGGPNRGPLYRRVLLPTGCWLHDSLPCRHFRLDGRWHAILLLTLQHNTLTYSSLSYSQCSVYLKQLISDVEMFNFIFNLCHVFSWVFPFKINIWVFFLFFFGLPGAVSLEACQPCLPGYYCAKAGLSSPSGLCSPGFYCKEGSRTATPWGDTTGNRFFFFFLSFT